MPPPPILWYKTPTAEYMSGLPLGNGRIAAMVVGDPAEGRIALNHGWLWRGFSLGWTLPDVADRLPAIRKLFFEGKTLEAGEKAIAELGVREQTGVSPYQPFGDLLLKFAGHERYTDYRRELDLSTGIATTSYRVNGVTYKQEVFAARDTEELFVRLTADSPGALNGELILTRKPDPDCHLTAQSRPNQMRLTGAFPEAFVFDANGQAAFVPNAWGANRPPDTGRAALTLQNATDVILRLRLETNAPAFVKPARPSRSATLPLTFSLTAERLENPETYARIRQRHIARHRKLFDRARLRLGTDDRAGVPTDQRLADLRAGKPDPALQALYFLYGRYLLIASSAPGGLPANLQGLWNEDLRPPWDADFHLDINLQMNYWPAEPANLSECHDPLFDYTDRLAQNGKAAAKAFYGCRGTFIPLTSDAWATCAKTQGRWSEWTGAAAWLAQHYWWRYEFTRDKAFLEQRAYPLFKEIAAFYQDYLVEDPRPNTPWQGRLVTVPSYSPENTFAGGTSPVSLCIGATMDYELIHDLFTHLIAASEILGRDADRRPEWWRVLRRLPPLQIGKYGQLQEWQEDVEETEPGHRHFSHLFALFPGDQITLEKTPELAKAARVSIERRLAHSGGHTGWSRSWLVGFYARLRDAEQAEYHLRHLITDFATVSLLDLHPPRIFQIDGNFGGTAGLIEMLLQSHHGVLRLLPALPNAWPEGEVAGLKARGNIEVAIRWAGGQATEATLKSAPGGPVTVQAPPGQQIAGASLGRTALPLRPGPEPQTVTLDCPAGKLVRLRFH